MPRLSSVIAFAAGASTPLILVLLIAQACSGSDFCPAPHFVIGPLVGLGGGAVAALAMAQSGRGWLGLVLAAVGMVVGSPAAAIIYGVPRSALNFVVVLGPPILVGLGIGYFLIRTRVRASRGPGPDVPRRSTEADA
jgi:hypothetical protein